MPVAVETLLESKGLYPVNKSDLLALAQDEEREARERNLDSFKHSDNSAMLNAIAQLRAAAANVSLAARAPLRNFGSMGIEISRTASGGGLK